VRELRNLVEQAVHLGDAVDPLPARTSVPAGPLPFKEAKEQLITAFERDYLAELIRGCEGNLSKASREAQIDRVYLRKLLRKHGLIDGDGETS
jgi:DNA-binding NtrC family response regulator